MSARLKHSSGAQLRALEMSTNDCTVFVEGPNDVFVYSRVVASISERTGLQLDVRSASELPTKGKPGLLEFFDVLKRNRKLVMDRATLTKPRTVMFCLDRDLDFFCKIARRSIHIWYTEHFELENYVFMFGDVQSVAGSLLCVSPAEVTKRLPHDWRKRAAEAWREWLMLCMTACCAGIECGITHRKLESQVNTPCDAPTDLTRSAELWKTLEGKHPDGDAAIGPIRLRVEREVQKRMRAGQWDTLFRGKWYFVFLKRYLEPINVSYAEVRRMLEVTLDFQDPWTDSFSKGMSRVLAKSARSSPR